MQKKICDMRTLLKYAKNAAICEICAIAYLHETDMLIFTSNLQTKFEVSGFIHSKDMAWDPKCRNLSHDPDYTHLGDSKASQG